jgi:hypothetical protein
MTIDQDIFASDNASATATATEPAPELVEMFDLDRDHPEPVYDNPPMTEGENTELELFDVVKSNNELTLKYRQPKHDGIATENYKIAHGPQKFVLANIIKRFGLKLRKETWQQDLVEQLNMTAAMVTKRKVAAYVVKASIGETLYNIDNKKS